MYEPLSFSAISKSILFRVAPHIASYPDLNPCDAEIKMRYCISEIKDVLMQAFGAVDLKEYGAVSIDVVKRVLDNFSFIMTEKQFNVSF